MKEVAEHCGIMGITKGIVHIILHLQQNGTVY